MANFEYPVDPSFLCPQLVSLSLPPSGLNPFLTWGRWDQAPGVQGCGPRLTPNTWHPPSIGTSTYESGLLCDVSGFEGGVLGKEAGLMGCWRRHWQSGWGGPALPRLPLPQGLTSGSPGAAGRGSWARPGGQVGACCAEGGGLGL